MKLADPLADLVDGMTQSERAILWRDAVVAALRAGHLAVNAVEQADVVVAAYDARRPTRGKPGFGVRAEPKQE